MTIRMMSGHRYTVIQIDTSKAPAFADRFISADSSDEDRLKAVNDAIELAVPLLLQQLADLVTAHHDYPDPDMPPSWAVVKDHAVASIHAGPVK